MGCTPYESRSEDEMRDPSKIIENLRFWTQFFQNLQIAVESSSDGVERADFTGMMVPLWSFSRYELILRGFVSDIGQNRDNLDFQRYQNHMLLKVRSKLELMMFHSCSLGRFAQPVWQLKPDCVYNTTQHLLFSLTVYNQWSMGTRHLGPEQCIHYCKPV